MLKLGWDRNRQSRKTFLAYGAIAAFAAPLPTGCGGGEPLAVFQPRTIVNETLPDTEPHVAAADRRPDDPRDQGRVYVSSLEYLRTGTIVLTDSGPTIDWDQEEYWERLLGGQSGNSTGCNDPFGGSDADVVVASMYNPFVQAFPAYASQIRSYKHGIHLVATGFQGKWEQSYSCLTRTDTQLSQLGLTGNADRTSVTFVPNSSRDWADPDERPEVWMSWTEGDFPDVHNALLRVRVLPDGSFAQGSVRVEKLRNPTYKPFPVNAQVNDFRPNCTAPPLQLPAFSSQDTRGRSELYTASDGTVYQVWTNVANYQQAPDRIRRVFIERLTAPRFMTCIDQFQTSNFETSQRAFDFGDPDIAVDTAAGYIHVVYPATGHYPLAPARRSIILASAPIADAANGASWTKQVVWYEQAYDQFHPTISVALPTSPGDTTRSVAAAYVTWYGSPPVSQSTPSYVVQRFARAYVPNASTGALEGRTHAFAVSGVPVAPITQTGAVGFGLDASRGVFEFEGSTYLPSVRYYLGVWSEPVLGSRLDPPDDAFGLVYNTWL